MYLYSTTKEEFCQYFCLMLMEINRFAFLKFPAIPFCVYTLTAVYATEFRIYGDFWFFFSLGGIAMQVRTVAVTTDSLRLSTNCFFYNISPYKLIFAIKKSLLAQSLSVNFMWYCCSNARKISFFTGIPISSERSFIKRFLPFEI